MIYRKDFLKKLVLLLQNPSSLQDKIQRLCERMDKISICVCGQQDLVRVCSGSGELLDTLYLTDSETMYHLLQEACLPVAGWEHDGSMDRGYAEYVLLEPEEMDEAFFECIFRRLCHIPWVVAETKRLLLRESCEDDLCSFYRIYAKDGITKYMEKLFEDPLEEKAYMESYAANIYRFYEYGIWTVVCKESGQIIGRVGAEPPQTDGLPELGFVIDQDLQHQGLGQEACQAVIGYLREHQLAEGVMAKVHQENLASIRLCKKLGLVENDKKSEHGTFSGQENEPMKVYELYFSESVSEGYLRAENV